MNPRIAIPKSNWAYVVLLNLDDDRFRSFVRMNRTSFHHILHQIQNDPVFTNNSNNQQTPVYAQLHYTLFTLGHDENASSYVKKASTWGISESHIYKCTQRVVTTLFNLKDSVITWPDKREQIRESILNDTREKFIRTVGKVDSTNIVLALSQEENIKESYFTIKKTNTP